MMEGRDLIRRSLAIGSWVCERKMVFAANFGLWIRPVVFIHYPYSNPHPSQMGRVWVEK
jgi:hypothetical protein